MTWALEHLHMIEVDKIFHQVQHSNEKLTLWKMFANKPDYFFSKFLDSDKSCKDFEWIYFLVHSILFLWQNFFLRGWECISFSVYKSCKQFCMFTPDTEKRLRRNLKKTKALLADAGTMLAKQKNLDSAKQQIAQLRNQVTVSYSAVSILL